MYFVKTYFILLFTSHSVKDYILYILYRCKKYLSEKINFIKDF